MSEPTCPSCGAALRTTSRFCPGCGAPVRDAANAAQQPGPTGGMALGPPGYTVPVARPPARPPGPQLKPGTVVKEESKRAGTVLYQAKNELPVCGWLVILRGRRQGRDFRIDKDTSVLGRDGNCDFVIEDDTVSRQHCRIKKEGEVFVIYDLGSGNGTYLNGERVSRAELTDGDVLKVGESLVLFKDAKPRVSIEVADVHIQKPPAPSSG